MTDLATDVPVVLSFSNSDPIGNGGIQADIETLISIGCHCAPIITAFSIDDSAHIKPRRNNNANIITEQAQAVLHDLPVAVIKLGYLGNRENIEAVAQLLQEYPNIPVIWHPNLPQMSETIHVDSEYTQALLKEISPLVTFLLLNTLEAKLFGLSATNNEELTKALLDLGIDYILLTGTHESSPNIVNTLYGEGELIETFSFARLPNNFNGAGCTLSAAIAGLIANEIDLVTAVEEAQQFTEESLKYSLTLGAHIHTPNRLFWAREESEEDETPIN